METLKLSKIILSKKPELFDCLTQDELDSHIILKNGVEQLSQDDLLQLIEVSIHENRGKDVSYH